MGISACPLPLGSGTDVRQAALYQEVFFFFSCMDINYYLLTHTLIRFLGTRGLTAFSRSDSCLPAYLLSPEPQSKQWHSTQYTCRPSQILPALSWESPCLPLLLPPEDLPSSLIEPYLPRAFRVWPPSFPQGWKVLLDPFHTIMWLIYISTLC